MWRYSLPALIWTAVVTVLCLLPGRDLPELNVVNLDKFVHLSVFGLLCWLYLRWYASGPNPQMQGRWAILVAVMLYGVLMEVLQGAFYTDRSADLMDAGANGVGCLFAFLLHLRR